MRQLFTHPNDLWLWTPDDLYDELDHFLRYVRQCFLRRVMSHEDRTYQRLEALDQCTIDFDLRIWLGEQDCRAGDMRFLYVKGKLRGAPLASQDYIAKD